MFKLLFYLIGQGVFTQKKLYPELSDDARGIPKLTDAPCSGSGCNACAQECPTSAIKVIGEGENALVSLDRGACITCGACVQACPTGTIVEDRSTKLARRSREALVLTNKPTTTVNHKDKPSPPAFFKNSIAARVVSTGCTACDMEIGASNNSIFDMERFGVSVVASPRAADALIVTGPVGKAMQEPLRRCYNAMAEPRSVIALGTCAISGGVHKNGYAEANGVDSILPVDVYIPGCPPHPWSIIHGVHLAMGKISEEQ
jgi:Ni,Fe-hydrogenase III small subunit/NAD-dependent dihydropyrimidine dehydrogenase PreA subunit